MVFINKLTSAAERLAHSQLAVPIIVETKTGYFQDVLSAIRGYLGSGRFGLRLPERITEIFSLLANVQKDSKVLDICAGTGGFLISAMHQMFKKSVF